MQTRSIDRTTLLNITFFVEAFLLLVATFWSHMADVPLAPVLIVKQNDLLAGLAAGLGLAVSSLILLWLGKSLGFLANLREIIIRQIAPIFQQLNWWDIFVLACVSGFCEEVLFRGVLQQEIGIWFTSLIFGIFHCPSPKHIAYGLWAFAAGLFLGWLMIQTGSLWVPIIAHALSNGISLLCLRYGIKPPPETSEE